MKLRKGDAPKAIALVVLIIAVLAFVGRTVMSAAGGGPHAQTEATAQATGERSGAKPVSEQMYAERPRAPAADIARAKGSPNPFLPAISTQQKPKGADAKKAPPAMPEMPNLRFLGTIGGDKGTMAVLTDGAQRYYVRRGESLPGGWSVAQVGSRSLTLKKGGQKATLILDQQSERK